MTAMPSPVDLRIWLLSRVLGWPGRKVADEVGVSQPTVVRTLERLSNDPPTDQEMQDFVAVAAGTDNGTPPRGIPALKTRRHHHATPLLTLVIAGSIALVAVAVTVVLIALAVAILSQ